MINISIAEPNLGVYEIPANCGKNTCVDIGANVGSFVCQNVNRFDKIWFYEPYKPCFDIVTKKTEGFSNVIGYNEAVYKEDDVVVKLVSHFNREAGSISIKTDITNDDWKEEIHEIKTVSLKTIIKRAGGHIDYLKCDCENSEYYLFMHQNLSEIDYIGIEIHCQMGKIKFQELVQYINKTHECGAGNISWSETSHFEVLFKNKKLTNK